MDLEDLVEAHIAGGEPAVPDELRADFDRAVAGYEALQDALKETVLLDGHPADDRPPPELPEDYELVRELGRGGMGVVYLVRQKSLGRLVAVKVLRPGEMIFGPAVRRFLGEARHLARLRHPHIVSVHEVGDAHGEPYFTMDYVEGEPLTALLSRGGLTPTRAIAVLRQSAEAVRHAHEQGIIHRDLKPGNILVDKAGHAYVTDFGLARDMTQAAGVTRSGEVMGTPAYMAPEQALGQADLVGEATDIHALGLILYEMVTGRPPYGRDTPAKIMVRLLREEPVPPRKLDRRIPRDLETICLKAMAKEPARRYATAGAFLEDLRRFETGAPPLARRPGPASHAWRWARRNAPFAAAVLVVGTLAAVAASALLTPWLVAGRTLDSMLAEAGKQHRAGDHVLAARLYTAALKRADAGRRGDILPYISRCVAETDNPKTALELALPLLEDAPELSFGEYDYLVARAVAEQTTAIQLESYYDKQRAQFFDRPKEQDRPKLERAEARLDQFLNGPHGTEAERTRARELRAMVHAKLAGERPNLGSYAPPKEPVLPKGTIEELRLRSEDLKLPRWARGKAAYAEAKARKEMGDQAAALDAYRRAYELIRSVLPFYPGDAPGAPSRPPKSSIPNFNDLDLRLLAECVAAIRRLDPSAPDPLMGGLRFRVEGLTIPLDVGINLRPSVTDPSVKLDELHAVSEQGYFIERTIILRGGQPGWLGVADGRYKLREVYRGKSRQGNDPDTVRLYSLLDVDTSALPDEVEIHGETIDLPAIRVGLLKEVKLLSPAEGGAADLREGFFRWSPVEGASSYRVNFTVYKTTPTGTSHSSYGPGLETKGTSLCLGAIPDMYDQIKKLGRELVPGATGEWDVEAFDATGRRIATIVGSHRRFLVARGLSGE
jgi:predicted Ser/Thr protein kinase